MSDDSTAVVSALGCTSHLPPIHIHNNKAILVPSCLPPMIIDLACGVLFVLMSNMFVIY